MDTTTYHKVCDVIDAVKTDETLRDTDDYAAAIVAAVDENATPLPMWLSRWTVARLKDSRESGEVDNDVSDAVIEREAAKLERLIYQIASSFVDNEFDEKE